MASPLRNDPPAPIKKVMFCPDEKPRCPAGHRLRTTQRVTTDGIMQCKSRDTYNSPECGILFYAALVTHGGSARVRGSGERLWLIIVLSPDEVKEIANRPAWLIERLDEIGFTPPGVRDDVLRALDSGDVP